MQVSKLWLIVSASSVYAALCPVQAQDNPAQAVARVALMKSMNIDPPPVPQPTNAALLVDSNGAVSVLPNSMPTNQSARVEPGPMDAETQAKVRAALLQSMDVPPTQAPAPAPAEMPVAPVPAPVTTSVKPTHAPVTAKAMTNSPTAAGATSTKPAKPATPMPANASISQFAVEPGYVPIVAPPLPITPAKQQQLDALLSQYQANQVSPEEYHRQRAAILAAP